LKKGGKMDKSISVDKIFFFPKNLIAFEKKATVKPIAVELHLTNACNNNCYYCSMKRIRDNYFLPLEKISAILNFLHNIGTKGIILSGGGEPTTHPNFLTILDLAYNLNLHLGLISNGIALDDRKIDQIIKQTEWIRISLDAGDSETYKKIRGTDDFQTVMANFQKLLETNNQQKKPCTVSTQIIVNKYNLSELSTITNFLLKELPLVKFIQIRPMETRANDFPYTEKELLIIKKQLKNLRRNKRVFISEKWRYFLNKQKDRFDFSICHCAQFIGAVDAHGKFWLCCHMINQPNYLFADLAKNQSINLFSKTEQKY